MPAPAALASFHVFVDYLGSALGIAPSRLLSEQSLDRYDALEKMGIILCCEELAGESFPTDLLDVLDTLSDFYHFTRVKAGHEDQWQAS